MNIVIVGAGLAGANAAKELRDQGYSGDVTLIGAEQHAPYERPPLSKGLLLGSAEAESVFFQDASWYADHQVELVTGTRVTGLDVAARSVALDDRELRYDELLLATGAQPRRMAFADHSGAEVAYLRTLEDALALKERLRGRLLVVGAGWIGLEVAAAARQAGADVTVVESAPHPLRAVLGPELAPLFTGLHREHGVELRLATSVESIDRRRHGDTVVRLSDGHEVHPDLILVSIGVTPDADLATRAGLATERGVLTDARLRTSDPHVFAAGDVAVHDHPSHGRIRVEHWDTAIHHGRHAARSILGDDAAYSREPYFFTDQYDLGMEYVGHVGPQGYDDVVVRGDRDSLLITALWLRGDRVVAGMHLNDWDAIDPLRTWVGRKATDALRDPGVALADVAT